MVLKPKALSSFREENLEAVTTLPEIRLPGFCLGFIIWWRSPAWVCAPEIFLNEYALRCNLVHFETQSCHIVSLVTGNIVILLSLDREYVFLVH